MSFLCLSVLHGGRAVIPWTVTGTPVGTMFLALFDQFRAGALEAFAGYAPVLQRLGLRQSFVGSAKDSLVHVDYHLPIDDVCRQFGSYVRLVAEEEERCQVQVPRVQKLLPGMPLKV